MPQMAPMWWTTLFMLFILCFLIVVVKIYFTVNCLPSKKINPNKKKMNMNWKW